jgi:hypothetical protein
MSTPTLPGSTGYGVDIYGTVLYGYSQSKSLSVEPFTAIQTDYGRISLAWTSPNDTSWRKLRLVRSTDGYPSTPNDGTLLLEASSDSIRNQYDDANLTQGVIYYYAVFMSQDAAAWNSGTTYIQSAVVFYNETYWVSLQASNTNHTPSIGSAWWAPTTYFPTWYPAGTVASLAVKNQAYTTHLYDRSPQPYKIIKSDLFANTTIDNPALASFLSLFGYQFDALKTSYDQLLSLNDVDKVSADNLEYLGQQFGVRTDYISSPRLRRNRVKNASVNYRLKGTWTGIHNAIAAVTGWDSELEVGPNMMLNSDQSAFVHPSYDLWNADTNYFVNAFVSYNGFNYKNLVASRGTAQAPTGANSSNTWWQVQTNSTDSTTLLNPSTGGFSTWGKYLPGSTTSTLNTIVGVPHPTIAATNTWNALRFAVTNSPVSGFTGVNSVTALSTPAWSNLTNYVANNYVLSNTFYYKALRKSGPASTIGAVTPGTNDLYWELQASNVGVGRGQFVRDGIPLPRYPTWDSVLPFKVGNTVQHNGILYICLVDNTGQSPTGRYASNATWQYLSPAEQAFTASYYTSRFTAATNVQSASRVIWYDDDGNTLFTAVPPTNATMFARFDTDYTNLDTNTDNTTSLAWSVTPSGATYWESTFGQARVNPDAFAALVTKPKYTYIQVADGRANGVIGYTFGADYEDTTNYDNGVIFRSTGTGNKWFCTRTRLVRILASFETTLASWPRLADYERITITLNGSSIIVRKYNRDGTGGTTTLASITDASLQTETIHGLIQRYALGT